MDVLACSQRLQDWLLIEGTRLETAVEFASHYALFLRSMGWPVDRVLFASLVTHPQASAYGITWTHGEDEVEVVERPSHSFEKLRYPGNPIDCTMGRSEALHLRLDDQVADDPALGELRRAGYTDYVAIELRFGGQFRGAVTWATRATEGFSEDIAACLFASQAALSAVLRPYIMGMCQRTLLRTYLGKGAGERVHRGEVRRGDGITTRTAIWFSDLRGFTKLTAALARDELLELLNDVFELIVSNVNAHGGEVLKFMGDGVLAIFPSPSADAEDSALVCRGAREAAEATQRRLYELSKNRQAQGKSAAAIGIGLHYGDVMYGNIGSHSRLDFTVIGSAVNLAARIEALCSRLSEDILMSASFAALEAGDSRSLGHHQLKGVTGGVEVFA